MYTITETNYLIRGLSESWDSISSYSRMCKVGAQKF